METWTLQAWACVPSTRGHLVRPRDAQRRWAGTSPHQWEGKKHPLCESLILATSLQPKVPLDGATSRHYLWREKRPRGQEHLWQHKCKMQMQERLEHTPLPSHCCPWHWSQFQGVGGTNWKWLWTGCGSIHSKIDRSHWLVWIYPQVSRWNYLLKDSLETKDHKWNRFAFLFLPHTNDAWETAHPPQLLVTVN